MSIVRHEGDDYDLVWDRRQNRVTIRVRLEWNYADDLTRSERTAVQTRFTEAVHGFWGSQQYRLEPTTAPAPTAGRVPRRSGAAGLATLGDQLPPPIQIHVELESVTEREHWDVEVARQMDRENVHPVTGNLNVALDSSHSVLAHEFGHALRQPDEYDSLQYGSDWCQARRGGPFELTCAENWRHDERYFGDVSALMNAGMQEPRGRYFFFVRDWLNQYTQYRYTYQVLPLRDGDRAAGDDRRLAVPPHVSAVREQAAAEERRRRDVERRAMAR